MSYLGSIPWEVSLHHLCARCQAPHSHLRPQHLHMHKIVIHLSFYRYICCENEAATLADKFSFLCSCIPSLSTISAYYLIKEKHIGTLWSKLNVLGLLCLFDGYPTGLRRSFIACENIKNLLHIWFSLVTKQQAYCSKTDVSKMVMVEFSALKLSYLFSLEQ